MNIPHLSESLEHNGFAIVHDVIDESTITELCKAIDNATNSVASRSKRGSTFAMRDLLNVVPLIREVAASSCIHNLIEPILTKEAFVARAIFFVKTPEANWKVAWHQDVSIAVCERIETPGFGPWSTKAGIMHVRPPTEVLEGMLTIRIHLDDCDESNGALQVIPGSHRNGFLDEESLQACRISNDICLCCVPAGGVVLMRPLIAHASAPGTNPSRRRVIHLEYAVTPLQGDLHWHQA